MTLVVIVSALLLLGVAVVALALPLLREGRGTPATELAWESAQVSDPLVDLAAQRDSIYQAIRELRFDHQVGKVSEADYKAFDTQLRSQAALVLKQIDELHKAEGDPALDAKLEAEIAALRQVNGTGPSQTVRPQPGAIPAQGAALNFCPHCGQRLQPGDRYCGKCGTALR